MAIFPGSAIPSAVSDYEIDNSVRFDDGDSPYLARTPTVAGNQKTWTLSVWVKRGNMGSFHPFFEAYSAGSNKCYVGFDSNDNLKIQNTASSSDILDLRSSAKYRDPSAWQHIVVAVDTTQSTDSNRVKIYVNGEQVTAFGTETYPSQDTDLHINSTYEHKVGEYTGDGAHYDGELAEFYLIDGTQLPASTFGELDSDTNQWKPLDSDDVKDAVTFGTNGFFQKYNSTELANSFTDSVKYIVTSFTTVESTTWTAPTGVTSVDYLVVAGGGEGGYDAGGGGGAGGYRTGTLSVTPGSSYTVTVGAGGTSTQSGSSKFGADGANSVFSSITSTGGGGAGSTSTSISGRTGGSGGGGGGYNASGGSGGAGNAGGYSPVEGYVGGAGASGATAAGGGGGGSSGAGAAGGSPTNAGGAGTSNSITGSAVTYAAGGTGNSDSSGSNTSGAANTGNGGNGGAGTPQGGAGGSGIVVVRYLSSSGTVSGHTITANGDATNQRPQHHNVTANGDAHLIGPKVGTSVISMDGTGDSIYAASSSDFNFGTGDFTLEAWMNNNGSGNEAIFAHFTSGTDKWYFIADYGNGSIAIYDRVSGLDAESKRGGSNGASLTNGAWHHVAAVRSSGVVKFYIDGKGQDNQVTPTLPAANFGKTATCYIGEDGQGSDYWKGYFGPLRISNSARYTADFDVPTTVWTNDGNTKLLIQNGTDGSQTFTDSSSSSHSITVNGDARWFAPKVGAGAMAFDGTGDYFSVPDSVDWDFGAGDFTIEFWAKIGASAPDGSMLSHYDVSSQRSWSVVLDATNNELEFVYSTDGSSATTAAFSWSYSEHTWYLVSICRSGADLKAFIDGTQIGSTHDISTSDLHNSTSTLTIGGDVRSGMGYLFKGAIDDLRIVRTALRTSNWTASTSAFTDSINTVLLLNADINQGTWAEDSSTGLAISTDSRMKFDGGDDSLSVADSSDWEFGSGDFCIEAWVNVSENTSTHTIWSTTNLDNYGGMFCNVGAAAGLYWYIGTGSGHITITAPALSAGRWYHVACVRSGTGSNETIIYVDGVSAATGTYTDNSQDAGANGFYVGDWPPNSWDLNGYVDEVRVSNVERYSGTFTPKGRGEPFTADANTKLLIHSDYTGGLGADSSGNYNNFTATGLVATDQVLDSPTNNFATLNPIANGKELFSATGTVTFSEGNLKHYNQYGSAYWPATMELPTTGKWYWECYGNTNGGQYGLQMSGLTRDLAAGSKQYLWTSSGIEYPKGTVVDSATYVSGDILGFAVNLDDGEIKFYKNNTLEYTGTNMNSLGYDYLRPCFFHTDGTTVWVNFGADSSFAGTKTAQGNQDGNDKGDFYYEPPSGHLALCTDNLPTPEIKLSGKYMDTALFTGTGSELELSSLSFQPDFTWIKTRQLAYNHRVFDAVRGVTKELYPNDNDAEVTDAQSLKSFDSDGFTLGTSSGINPSSSSNMVSWNWKAGGAPTATNVATSGAMTSGSVFQDGSSNTSFTPGSDIYPYKISANTESGISIITYEGNGDPGDGGQTIPHGLSQAPELVFIKQTDADNDWYAGATPVGWTQYGALSDGSAFSASAMPWRDTAPTSSFITIGGSAGVNDDGDDYVCYAFHSVEGYSKVGSYEGNGNVDGTFIYTGFEPAFVITKRTDSSGDWVLLDVKRNTYNEMIYQLMPNANYAEGASSSSGTYRSWTTKLDMVSNGFKHRWAGDAGISVNVDGGDYIYIAFAESPFKYSNAR